MTGNIKQLCLVSKQGEIRLLENWSLPGNCYPIVRVPRFRNNLSSWLEMIAPSSNVVLETAEYRVIPGHDQDSDILILEET